MIVIVVLVLLVVGIVVVIVIVTVVVVIVIALVLPHNSTVVSLPVDGTGRAVGFLPESTGSELALDTRQATASPSTRGSHRLGSFPHERHPSLVSLRVTMEKRNAYDTPRRQFLIACW
jgi:hypothetical protein